MSVPQAQFILVVNQDQVENIQKALPGIVLAQVFGHEIGLEKALLLATPKPVPAPVEVPELPVEDVVAESVIVPEEKSNE
jgi:hypothetical protein